MLRLQHDDFKTSFAHQPPFSRLHVKVCLFVSFLVSFPVLSDKSAPAEQVVEELIWSGRRFLDIGIEDTGVGYLSPHEWHDALTAVFTGEASDSVILDVRTQKVCAGRPSTIWVDLHSATQLLGRTRLCAGGHGRAVPRRGGGPDQHFFEPMRLARECAHQGPPPGKAGCRALV